MIKNYKKKNNSQPLNPKITWDKINLHTCLMLRHQLTGPCCFGLGEMSSISVLPGCSFQGKWVNPDLKISTLNRKVSLFLKHQQCKNTGNFIFSLMFTKLIKIGCSKTGSMPYLKLNKYWFLLTAETSIGLCDKLVLFYF